MSIADHFDVGSKIFAAQKDIDNEGQRAVPRMPETKQKFQETKDNEAVIINRTDLDSAVAVLEVLDVLQSKYLGPTHKARLETERLIRTLKGN